jgi:hypothetical protein
VVGAVSERGVRPAGGARDQQREHDRAADVREGLEQSGGGSMFFGRCAGDGLGGQRDGGGGEGEAGDRERR